MLGAPWVLRWLAAFGVTQAIEVPIYRRTLRQRVGPCFGASAITHPLVWVFLASGLWKAPWTARVTVVELWAWLAEAAYFHLGYRCRRALRWTFVANAASFALGLASRWAFGWP
jgi:hypothetical protein